MTKKRLRQRRQRDWTTRWLGLDSEVARRVAERSAACLEAYRVNPMLVDEHTNIEIATAQGGYGRRQIYELVQNGADAMTDGRGGRIHVLLTPDAMYCANEGDPIDLDGVDCMLSSHVSMKRGAEIGRFGLGFKSVLGVSRQPEFYSQSGSFIFNEVESRAHISRVVPGARRYPTLRLAFPVDPRTSAERDEILADLLTWATTVVKLPRAAEASRWLSDDLAGFPAEFLLFSPHVRGLILEDRTRHEERHLLVRHRGNNLILTEGQAKSEWAVFQRVHEPSEEARRDAGELAERNQVPIIWAVPLEGKRHKVGTFWAFFPTVNLTTLSGIVNAPWKTNEDRQNLLPGSFNNELLDVLGELVVDNMRHLPKRDDPASYLDVLPARGRETRNWADERLTERVYELAKERPSIPDQDGVLRCPDELKLHPENTPADALAIWAAHEGRPRDWCHPSVETRERRPRVIRLMGDRVADYREWLEALAASENPPAASVAAICAAEAALNQAGPEDQGRIRSARIVLTETGDLVAPDPNALFLASWDYSASLQVALVSRLVQGNPDVQKAIQAFGLKPVDPSSEIESLLSRLRAGEQIDWGAFWRLTRNMEAEACASLIRAACTNPRVSILAMTQAGTFEPLWAVLWPGPIVPTSDSSDDSSTVDSLYHLNDQTLLSRIGCTPTPGTYGGSTDEPWFPRYSVWCRQQYFPHVKTQQRPMDAYLVFRAGGTFPGPLVPLTRLTQEGRSRFCMELISCGSSFDSWRMEHETRGHVYPAVEMLNPAVWAAREFGALPTSLGEALPVADCVGPQLEAHKDVLPSAGIGEAAAELLGLPSTTEEIDERVWGQAIDRAAVWTDDFRIGKLYALASEHVAPPPQIRCRVGLNHEFLACVEVVALSDPSHFEAVAAQGIPYIRASSEEDVGQLVERWGLRPPSAVLQSHPVSVLAAALTPIVDEFPALWAVIPDSNFKLGRCLELRLETLTSNGKTSRSIPYIVEDNTLFYLDEGDEKGLLLLVAKTLGIPEDDQWADAVLEDKLDSTHRGKLQRIRQEAEMRQKVLAMLGVENLLRHLPSGLLEAARQERDDLGPLDVADLALAVYNIDLLREFKTELEELGLRPPTTWAGSRAARAFVRDTGFPKEFAGAPQSRADALLRVFGPPEIAPLHDFQVHIKENTLRLLTDSEDRRGFLSLPTGAGKTRVAVESLVTWYRTGRFDGPLLWIAQTEELCEQAVQTFGYVWRGLGSPDELFISRLWGANEAEPMTGAPQFVIATIQKLQNCVGKRTYEWLADAECVVVDEAHRAIAPSYTKVLAWLGLGRSRARDRCPLLGLSATPYRGTSVDETKRLVSRFGRRLDHGVLGDCPYEELQAIGVLAQVKHELLEGVDVDLSDLESEAIRAQRRLPDSVAERIGSNVSRNRRLQESIRRLPRDWPVLLFAASVSHAQTMAALLQLDGVPSAAVHGGTDLHVRRHCTSEFRAGHIRVLANYGVFTEGFDAPGVKALYVARPVFSPGLYQQMIGRGLRGPANGGKEECLIVNVADNIGQFGQELAFREFEHLWVDRE